MAEHMLAVPEFVESELRQAIHVRDNAIAQWRDVGAPDLVHLTKVPQARSNSKEVGSYHHVLGLEILSSASGAAYINTLTYAMGQSQQWFSKGQVWKISRGVYCCFNAFSRVDMRVEVKIPGGVETYAVDDSGQIVDATPELWQEAYMSSIIRSFLLSDDYMYRMAGIRRLNPLPDLKSEARLLEAAEALFFQGTRVGSAPEVQVPTVTSNYLVDTLMAYFKMTGRWQKAIELFEKLTAINPECTSLLIESCFEGDLEIKAIRLAHDRLLKNPLDSATLILQAKFLIKRGRIDLALKCAKKAVDAAPSDFKSWATLTEAYIANKEYEQALLTLNSCPMFTYLDKDICRFPLPAQANLPIPPDTDIEQRFEEVDSRIMPQEISDSNLARLPAPSLKGTFAAAYNLLLMLSKNVGWDSLLSHRSNVFVMEEEYRNSRTPERELESNADGVSPHKADNADASPVATAPTDTNGDNEIQKPNASETNKAEAVPGSQQHGFFSKRLCERWLDNLFMVLYEDLRVFTLWRAEFSHYKSHNLTYEKKAVEWEILGELAQRLHHDEEAIDAYTQAVAMKFSHRSWRGLAILFQKQHQLEMLLFSLAQLTFWTHRWYQEFSPFLIGKVQETLVVEGALRVKSVIAASDISPALHTLMDRYFKLAENFELVGYNM